MLHLIFHLRLNGPVNDSVFPAGDGGSSAASTLESGHHWNNSVNEPYFYSVTVLHSSLRAVRRGRQSDYWPRNPAKTVADQIPTFPMIPCMHVWFSSHTGHFKLFFV